MYQVTHGKPNPHPYKPDHEKSPAVDAQLDRIPGCETNVAGRAWLSFPLMMWKSYHGGDPGPDRVVAVATLSAPNHYTNIHYCLSSCHSGNYSPPANPPDISNLLLPAVFCDLASDVELVLLLVF
jgi:hypothetical protein